jgi:multidrug resistance efflux pump
LKKKLDEEQTNPFFEREHYKTYYHSMTSEKEQTIKKKNNSYEELCRLVAEYESQIKEAEQEIDKAKLMIEMKDDEINKLVYELKREKRKS